MLGQIFDDNSKKLKLQFCLNLDETALITWSRIDNNGSKLETLKLAGLWKFQICWKHLCKKRGEGTLDFTQTIHFPFDFVCS